MAGMVNLLEQRRGSTTDRHNDKRSPYEHDLSRVSHCAAFRRLQNKTQVLGLGDGDFTHSLEVAQIAEGITYFLTRNNEFALSLPLDPTLMRTICFIHDIGHPPFGHGGEIALNRAMVLVSEKPSQVVGFEGNAQSLRIISKLEKQTDNHGLNLTRRTLLGILKYPAPFSKVSKTTWSSETENWKPPKCYFDDDQEIVDWMMDGFCDSDRRKFQKLGKLPTETDNGATVHKSLDCSIMDIADEISYGAHDLEDCIKLRLITKDDWHKPIKKLEQSIEEILLSCDKKWREQFQLNNLFDCLFSEQAPDRKGAIGAIVHAAIASVKLISQPFEAEALSQRVVLATDASKLVEALSLLVKERVIFTPNVQHLEFRGQSMVQRIFDAYTAEPSKLIPSSTMLKIDAKPTSEANRIICDHISGMTDGYANKVYKRLFVAGSGSVFDRV